LNTITRIVERRSWQGGEVRADSDEIVAEMPVALVYNGISHVVMMATPADLEDLALGFSLSEGILQQPGQMLELECLEREQGVELAMTIAAGAFNALKQRRRNLAGRTGCGLCGVESLAQAIPAPQRVTRDCRLSHRALQAAVLGLGQRQSLKRLTGGVHGAAWCTLDGDIVLLREDVGRHNALDKLLGALQRGARQTDGFVLVTSRASYEMVAKVAACNIPLLAAVSAPTSLAVAQAMDAGITLVGFVQPGRHVIYANPHRLAEET